MNSNIPNLYDEDADLPQFPELTELRQKKRSLKKRAAESEENYWKLTHIKLAGRNSVSDPAANVERVLSGQDLPFDGDVDIQLKRESAQYSALLEAIRLIDIKIAAATHKAAQEICDTLRPTHDKIMRKLAAALADAHSADVELFAMERTLINSGVGLRGICNNRPSFLGIPVNKTSDLAAFLRQAKADGFISAVPKEFK